MCVCLYSWAWCDTNVVVWAQVVGVSLAPWVLEIKLRPSGWVACLYMPLIDRLFFLVDHLVLSSYSWIFLFKRNRLISFIHSSYLPDLIDLMLFWFQFMCSMTCYLCANVLRKGAWTHQGDQLACLPRKFLVMASTVLFPCNPVGPGWSRMVVTKGLV